MRKGAAVGSGRAPERRHASDPRLHGATLFPAPPRRVGPQALWPGDGAGAAAAGFGVGDRGGWVRSGFWSGAWSGNAGSEPPLMEFLWSVWLRISRFDVAAAVDSGDLLISFPCRCLCVMCDGDQVLAVEYAEWCALLVLILSTVVAFGVYVESDLKR
ncbi:hypothetical protein U9M48_026795 [Paspalum notatum var. saurae]|uniref:Uncharacterized protein n=1 Tax=Paspalum notatum var. saurae TaxID=547442 RepID=A0AAQ3TY81_PASNO